MLFKSKNYNSQEEFHKYLEEHKDSEEHFNKYNKIFEEYLCEEEDK